MSTDFYIGMAVPLLAITMGGVLYVALRALAWLTAKIAVTAISTKRDDTNRHQRASFASVVFSGERCWFWTGANLGIGVIIGQDVEARRDAYAKLNPPVTLRDLGLDSDLPADRAPERGQA